MIKKVYFFSVFIFVFVFISKSQQNDPIHWEFETNKLSENTYELKITAYIDGGCKLYGPRNSSTVGKPLRFQLKNEKTFKSAYDFISDPLPAKEYDDVMMIHIEYFKGKVQFMKIIELIKDDDIQLIITGQVVDYNKSKSTLINKEHSFKFKNDNDE